MATEVLDSTRLEALLERSRALAQGPADPANEPEHPLARQLRTVVADPERHTIGDLSRIVDTILAEMHLAAPGITGPSLGE
jgi:hypothetical protein